MLIYWQEADEVAPLAGSGGGARMGRANETDASADHLATPTRTVQVRQAAARSENLSEDASSSTTPAEIRQTVLHISAL